MKKIYSNSLLFLCMAVIFMFSACNDKLSIFREYEFTLETMPVPTKIQRDETIEIRCRIIREGVFDQTKFYIRYFQSDGKGCLKLNNQVFSLNDLYPLPSDNFRLYYTSQCEEQQKIDIYIEDSFGQTVQKSFSFTDHSRE